MAGAVGPLWTDGDGGRYPGRYPLAVERHAMARVGHLLPGITTVTPHARYYTLHTAVFAEAKAKSLDEAANAPSAAAGRGCGRSRFYSARSSRPGSSRRHAFPARLGAPRPSPGQWRRHRRPLRRRRILEAGWGFWGPYIASEFAMGLLATEGKKTVEGPKADTAALRTGFAGLFDLSSRSSLSVDELAAASHLCMCQTRTSQDGLMLQRILIPESATAMHHDDRRAQTLRMLLRLTDLTADAVEAPQLDRALAFGDVREDPDLQAFEVFPAWTGVVLRTFTVTGWRNLWKHLVASVEGFMPIDVLGDVFADGFPAGSVRDFVASRPPGMEGLRCSGRSSPPRSRRSAQAEAHFPAWSSEPAGPDTSMNGRRPTSKASGTSIPAADTGLAPGPVDRVGRPPPP